MIEDFIRESNLIDTQEDIATGQIIPGTKPGDLLYDNHVRALEVAIEGMKDVKPSLCLDVHRELTRGILFFEMQNGSGQYRPYDVCIGMEKLPNFRLVKGYTEEKWIPYLSYILDEKNFSEPKKYEEAWKSHYAFECIHPFIDGNGRTGRILLNALLITLKVEPVVIYYKNRFSYYDDIRRFRKHHFDTFIKEGKI